MNLGNRYERLSAGILTPAVEETPCVFDRRRYGFPNKANMITDMITAPAYLDMCVCNFNQIGVTSRLQPCLLMY